MNAGVCLNERDGRWCSEQFADAAVLIADSNECLQSMVVNVGVCLNKRDGKWCRVGCLRMVQY